MTSSPRNFHRFFCALATALGLLLLGVSQIVSSLLIPVTWVRIDSNWVLAFGILVTLLGLASWRLPTPFSMILASSVATLVLVFALGYRPVQPGDISIMMSGPMRKLQSDHEWTEVSGRPDARYGWSNMPNSTARQVHRDFSVTYHYDSDGWRRLPVLAPETEHGEIWFVGCSFTLGVGVEDEEAYPYRLAAEAWQAIQVRSFTVSGWGTTQAYRAMQDQLERRPAPNAIVYGLINHHRERNYLRKSWFEKSHALLIPRFEVENNELRWLGMVPGSEANLEDGPELDAAEYQVTDALIRGMARLSREHGVPFILLVLDDTEARLLDPLRDEPGLHILDVSHLSFSFHPNEGHPTAVWHQTIAHAIAANPLIAELTGLPELLAPDSIPDPPMRAWFSSWNRNDADAMRPIIAYPSRTNASMHIELSGVPIGDPWKAVVQRNDFAVRKNQVYSLELRARSAAPRPILVQLSTGEPPWQNLGLDAKFGLSTDWQSIRRVFIAAEDDPAAWLMLLLGESDRSLEIADEPKLLELSGPAAAEALAILARPSWRLAVKSPSEALLSHATADATPPFSVRVTTLSDSDIWTVQLQYDGLKVRAGQQYTFELVARAPDKRPLEFALTRDRPDWDNLGLWGRVDLSPEWQTIRRDFLANETDAGSRLVVALGASSQSVEIAQIRLLEGSRELLLRQ